jgi:CubicO group peptidase (beta-lactamase class C family)
MAILKLAEQGKLKLEDPVAKYFAGSPPSWEGITLYHLLSHTSGIPNAEIGDFPKGIAQRYSPTELVEIVRTKPLDFQPGSKRKYSNSGYYLLGYIVEKVTGQKYAEYIDQNIFKPLGMNNSGYETNTSILRHKAQGYGVDGNTLQNADYLDWSIPYSAGALYSTTEDLLRWDKALYTEKLLSRPWLDRLFSPDKSGYNYGWFIKDEKGRTKIYHEGGNPGFAAFIARYPKDRTVVIVLSNLETAPVAKIADDLAAMSFEK